MNCPKCGAHIPFYNLKSNCYNCGVNIFYYMQDSGLKQDAKRTELEFASARIIGAKLKSAFIGGGLQIARLVMIFAVVAMLVLPFGGVTFAMPDYSVDFSISGLGIYNMISAGSYADVLNYLSSTLFGSATAKLLVISVLYVLIVLLAVALLVLYVLCFISNTRLSKAMVVISYIMAGFSVADGIVSLVFKSSSDNLSAFSFGFGAFIAAVVFIANGILNHIIVKKNIQPKIKEVDILRKETLRKIKKGEITFDDLTLPVFETGEEKEKRLKDLEEALKKEEEGKE